MILFKCPVCTEGSVETSGPDVAACNACNTRYAKRAGDVFLLSVPGSEDLRAKVDELDRQFPDGLAANIWDAIANGFTPGEPRDLEEFVAEKEQEHAAAAVAEAKAIADILISTTNSIDGANITDYKGVVSSHVNAGINIFKDFAAGLRNITGGMSKSLHKTMNKLRIQALDDIRKQAHLMGANAVIGIHLDFDEYSEGMLIFNAYGTAVVFERR